jgi:maleylacetoacetate isomerase
VVVDLLGKAHKSPEHLKRNPQGLVPALEIDGLMLTQSLAIIEYIIETRGVSLLPDDAAGRARVRALAHSIAMEIHPVCNLSVVGHVLELAGGGDAMRVAWMQKWIGAGLQAFEKCSIIRTPGHSAMAMHRGWQISALSRRSTMPNAGARTSPD